MTVFLQTLETDVVVVNPNSYHLTIKAHHPQTESTGTLPPERLINPGSIQMLTKTNTEFQAKLLSARHAQSSSPSY